MTIDQFHDGDLVWVGPFTVREKATHLAQFETDDDEHKLWFELDLSGVRVRRYETVQDATEGAQ